MAPAKILLTGATGFIGGSTLYHLLQSTNEDIKKSQISVLIRGDAEKAKSFSDLGVNPILFDSLDEVELLEKVASEHDVVIHTAFGLHTPAAVAFIKGLGKRKAATGIETKYIHQSGASNLGDRPISKTFSESREFADTDPDIYAYLQSRESGVVYPQRTTDIAIVKTGKEVHVKTYIIMSPTIYGFAVGQNATSNLGQISKIMRSALEVGQAEVVGDGKGEWDYVHIQDLVVFYELLLAAVLEGTKPVPSGEKGIFFAGSGRYSWGSLSQSIATVGHKLGYLKTDQVKSLTLDEASKWSFGNTLYVELGFSSNSRTRAVIAREVLGWSPKKTQEDWEKNIEEEWKVNYDKKQ